MELIVAEDIMTEKVISVDIDSLVSEARKKMSDNDLKKIVVTKQGKPEYILLEWKVFKEDGNKKINEIIESLNIVNMILLDEDIDDIRRDLQREPALVVMDYNKQMVGVVTATDLYKSMSKTKYTKTAKR